MSDLYPKKKKQLFDIGPTGVYADTFLPAVRSNLENFSTAPSLEHDLNAIRSMLKEIKQTAHWYDVYTGGGGGGGEFVTPPATETSPGEQKQQAWDGTYWYMCVATNVWVRTVMVKSW